MNDQTATLLQEFRAFRDTEFREFRDEVNSWRQDSAERLATLEAHDKDLYGNGKPGRMTTVESKVERVIRYKYWLAGGLACLTVCAGVLARLFIQ